MNGIGAIKKGDDAEDYKYEWNPKIAIPVGLGGGLVVTTASLVIGLGVLYAIYYKIENYSNRADRYRRKPLKTFDSTNSRKPRKKRPKRPKRRYR